jgi:tape measure domain-containing protein
MNAASGGSNLVFGLQAQDINLGSTLDAEAQRIARFGQQAAQAFQQFSQAATATGQASRTTAQAANDLSQNTDRAAKSANDASGAFATLGSRIKAIGEGLIIYKAFATVESAVGDLAKSIIALPAAYEQAEIGFKAMLGGDAQAADVMLGKLQQLANVTPFKFTEETQAARTLLGLGQAAEKVLPELVDIDTAVAAVGGNEQQVQRVAAALGKMSAEGRVSAVFMNELTRDGIPAWVMLSEEMGISVEKVRELSQNGELAASTFEKAFHDYTVKHWGDALSAQSQTFNGLISTAQDLFEQFTRVFGMPIIQELEPKLRGAMLALQDPAVIKTLEGWGQAAATFVGWIFEAVGGVAQLLGLPTVDLGKNMQSASDAVKQFAGDWSQTAQPIAATKDQVAGIRDDLAKMRDAEAEMALGYEHQIAPLQERVTLLDRAYERENAMANLAVTQEKLARDRILAQNIYTQQGRDAAARLPEEEARLAEQQRGIKHTSDKEALQDHISALQAQEKAEKESYDRRERELEARIRALEKPDAKPTGTPGGPTGPSGPLAGDDIGSRYASSVVAAAGDKAPTLLERLFGTPDQRATAVTDFFADMGKIVGSTPGDPIIGSLKTQAGKWIWEGLQPGDDAFGKAITAFDHSLASWVRGDKAGVFPEWRATIGASLWDAIMTPPAPSDDAFGAFMTNLDHTLAMGIRHALGVPDDANFSKTDFWQNEVDAFGKANKQIGDAITAPFRNAEATTARQRSKPDHYPTGHDPGGAWVAGKSYQDGTTDWTWQDGHSVGYNGAYSGGRALGGPVAAHGVITVGEQGPETLRMGDLGGYITPDAGGGQLTIVVQTDRGDVLWRETFARNRDWANKQIAISMRGA